MTLREWFEVNASVFKVDYIDVHILKNRNSNVCNYVSRMYVSIKDAVTMFGDWTLKSISYDRGDNILFAIYKDGMFTKEKE